MRIENIWAKGYGNIQLIIDEKTALVDCAMSINEKEILDGIRSYLGSRPLDYVLLTHSHFDHVGCLSALRREYPGLEVFASEKTSKVFKSEGARSFIKKMTEDLAKVHTGEGLSAYDDSGLYVDYVVGEGDEISLGNAVLTVVESKGHTDCSISFWCREEATLFASESCGVWFGKFPINLEICKGYKDVLASIRKQRKLGVEKLYVSHSGLFTGGSPNEYFSMAEYCMIRYKDLVYTAFEEGRSDEEIWQLCKENIYDVMLENGILMDSYERWLVNTKAFVSFARKDYCMNK